MVEGAADLIASMESLISRTPVMKTRMSPPSSRDSSRQWATCERRYDGQHSAITNREEGGEKETHRSAHQPKINLLTPRRQFQSLQRPNVTLLDAPVDKARLHALELSLRGLSSGLAGGAVGVGREEAG